MVKPRESKREAPKQIKSYDGDLIVSSETSSDVRLDIFEELWDEVDSLMSLWYQFRWR